MTEERCKEYCHACGKKLEYKERISFDVDSNVLILDNKSIRLTTNQIILIRALISAYPRTLSTAFLMDCIYGLESEEPANKIISVYLCKIRKQLKNTNYRIDTVFGKGLRFVRIENSEEVRCQNLPE